ncbi:MAG: adenylate kinase [Oscillospiraceae bacterium]|nr:adenylate kinase [Oscillospiraceae bacterium]
MIYLIAGASHTGKTVLAQRILEEKHIPYLSLDHLKMGLIRSGNTDLTVFDDDKLTDYLWPIAREMVKTAIENGQSLTIEGCYIPHSWAEDFEESYRSQIRAVWLIMTEGYIESRFADIQNHANAIEQRLDDSGLSKEELKAENRKNLALCRKYGCEYILIDETYEVKIP